VRNRVRSMLLAVCAALLVVVVVVPPSGAATGFLTSRRPQLRALAPGVQIVPILSAGDVVPGTDVTGGGSVVPYQATGVMDGGGFFLADGRMELFFNHELDGSDPTFSRVSHVTLNAAGRIVDATYAVDGTEGYKWFCSSTMSSIDGHPWYTTGEEDGDPGRSVAIDALTGDVIETPQFGLLSHENVVPLTLLGASPIAIMITEDEASKHSQQYMYTAHSWADALAGRGTLRVWVPNAAGDGDPSGDDIAKGMTLAGRFVALPGDANASAASLEAAAQDLGAFDFVRGEDGTQVPGQPGVFYLADTGTNGKTPDNGRIYRFDLDPARPTHATLRVALDSAVDPIVNPDNLAASATTLVIQEDQNWENRKKGYSDVWAWNFATGALIKAARVNVPDKLAQTTGGGYWESSGAVDASSFFGPGWWLMEVQAHSAPSVPQPGEDLTPNSATGEDAQLLRVYIPDSG
jgi:hypothetical protein